VATSAEATRPTGPLAVMIADDADQRVENGGVLGDQHAGADALVGQRGDALLAARQLQVSRLSSRNSAPP
jgi:hypothetical protein